MEGNVEKIKYLVFSMGIASIVITAIYIVFIVMPWLFEGLATFVYDALTSTVNNGLLGRLSIVIGGGLLIVNLAYCFLVSEKPISKLELIVAWTANIALGIILYPGIFLYLTKGSISESWNEFYFQLVYVIAYVFLFFVWLLRAFGIKNDQREEVKTMQSVK